MQSFAQNIALWALACLACAFLEMLQVDTDMGMQIQWWLYCTKMPTGRTGNILASVKLLAQSTPVQKETI